MPLVLSDQLVEGSVSVANMSVSRCKRDSKFVHAGLSRLSSNVELGCP